MKNLKNKTIAISIALLLTISMAASIMLIPTANAHTPAWSIPTYAYISAAPDPVGVGQSAHVYMWLDPVYGAAGGTTAANGGNGSTASAALLSNSYRFKNYNLTMIAPDGTVTTQLFATVQDTTSSQYYIITPNQVGTYTLIFSFPGQVYGANGDGYEGSPLMGDTYLPSNATTTLTVQQSPIPASITSYPLPTAYWERPIYGENTDWYTITSNWLGNGSPYASSVTQGTNAGTPGPTLFHPDGAGSLTSHIMWTKPIQAGGVVGGVLGTNALETSTLDPNALGVGYFEGSAYRQRFYNPIIVDGILYYNPPLSFNGANNGPLTAVDLKTGQVLWTNPNISTGGAYSTSLSFAYVYNLWSGDEHGTFPPILVAVSGTTWRLYDADTGVSLFNVTGVPTGTATTGPEGEVLRYAVTNYGTNANPDWRLTQWNSSRLFVNDINPVSGGGSGALQVLNMTAATGKLPTSAVINVFPLDITAPTNIVVNGNIPLNATTAALDGTYANWISTYDWNISINSWRATMPNSPTIVAVHYGDMMLLRNGSLPNGFSSTSAGTSQGPFTFFAINLNASRGTVGNLMWMKTYDAPAGNLTITQEGVDFDRGVFTLSSTELRNFYGYSLTDGSPLYVTPSQNSFDYYGNPMWTVLAQQIAYGNMYSASFGGILYCYDDVSGQLLWTYGNGGAGNSTNGGYNVFYGNYPTFIQAISNNVVYLISTEHTITDPIYKGAMARAVNATNGQEIWTLSAYSGTFYGDSYALADGINVWFNGYDNSIYAVGRGPSSLTVSAPNLAAASGQPVVISGKVTDISSGTKQTQQAADFPNGVPVASDASMKDWMGYVYQQKPLPTNFTGVPVSIDVVDSNGNYRNIGTATTDYTGAYSLVWQPDISGTYNVIATFAGTNAYWPSSGTATFNVMSEHPTATPAPTAAPSVSDMYFVPAVAGIIVAIVIVGALIMLLLLRKHP